MISIIIPIFNELNILSSTNFISYIKGLESEQSEIIFVDGGSEDGSQSFLIDQGFQVISSELGRAKQMNAGAVVAKGTGLLFLHCDTELKATVSDIVAGIEGKKWGFCSIYLDDKSPLYRLIGAGIRFRANTFSVASGDQGIFVDAELFRSVGAYPEIALMEDVALTRKLKTFTKPYVSPLVIEASTRRWRHSGVIRMILFMWFIQLAYKLGVPPARLNIWYRRPFKKKRLTVNTNRQRNV